MIIKTTERPAAKRQKEGRGESEGKKKSLLINVAIMKSNHDTHTSWDEMEQMGERESNQREHDSMNDKEWSTKIRNKFTPFAYLVYFRWQRERKRDEEFISMLLLFLEQNPHVWIKHAVTLFCHRFTNTIKMPFWATKMTSTSNNDSFTNAQCSMNLSSERFVCNTELILDQLWTNNQNGSNVWNIQSLLCFEFCRNGPKWRYIIFHDFICVRLCVLRTHFDTNEFIRAYNFSRCMRKICANKSRSIYVNEVILRTMRSQWNTYYAILNRWHCSWHVQMSTKKLKKELRREQRSPAHRHNTVRLCTSPFTIRFIHTACHVC